MINHDHGVVLDTIGASDIEQMRLWRNDVRISTWCRQQDLISPAAQLDWYLRMQKDPTQRLFKVATLPPARPEVISYPVPMMRGVCGLTSLDFYNRRAEFSLYIGPDHQGKGYGRAALETLLQHAFVTLGLNLVWGETIGTNPALSLFQTCGMRREGRRQSFYWKGGVWQDSIMISVTAGQWKARRRKLVNDAFSRGAEGGPYGPPPRGIEKSAVGHDV